MYSLLADAVARPKAERVERVLAVGRKLAALVLQPALGDELVGTHKVLRIAVRGPLPDAQEGLGGVSRRDAEQRENRGGKKETQMRGADRGPLGETHPLGHVAPADHGAALLGPPRKRRRHGRVHAHGLVEHGQHVGQALARHEGDLVLAAERRADLVAQPRQHPRVGGQVEGDRREYRGGGLGAGDDKGLGGAADLLEGDSLGGVSRRKAADSRGEKKKKEKETEKKRIVHPSRRAARRSWTPRSRASACPAPAAAAPWPWPAARARPACAAGPWGSTS
ncbi:hypothetical protein VTK73DRAFT_5487 [Phialemonium thermophilum]|uniref:Uncharacterized protein n=1 Tax=Phialemonium thermophilum TaxID=223376 RepID=A0ABR3V214_9PEZI